MTLSVRRKRGEEVTGERESSLRAGDCCLLVQCDGGSDGRCPYCYHLLVLELAWIS